MEWPLFSGVPDEDVRRVLATARRRAFKRDEILFHEGDPADSLHLIAKGRVGIHVSTPMGERTTIDVAGKGEVVGEMALLDDTPRMATVQALEATETLAVHRSGFEELRAKHPSVSAVLIKILAERVRRLGSQVVEGAYVTVEKRLLRRLVRLYEIYADGVDGEVVISLTQEHLAGLAATTRSTVNRALRSEEEAGVLRLTRGRITIIDAEALRKHAR